MNKMAQQEFKRDDRVYLGAVGLFIMLGLGLHVFLEAVMK